MIKIPKNIDVKIEFSPEEIAKAFCDMDGEDQAKFFNAISAEVKTWDAPFVFQLQSIVDTNILTSEGKKIMKEIGDSSVDF